MLTSKRLRTISETLSLEMIDPQVNDKFTKDLIAKFDEIRNAFINNGYVTNAGFLKSPDNVKLLEDIEDMTKKRIGIRPYIKLADEYYNFGVVTLPPPRFNIIDGDVNDWYKDMQVYFSKNPTTSDNVMWYKMMKSLEGMNKALNTDGILIDRKNAVMKNLPEEYKVYVTGDLAFYINEVKKTSEEIAATFIHEMGHAWTTIEASYRTIYNTTVLLESIGDSVIKQNKDAKESLLLAYEKTFKKSGSELKDKNINTVFLAAVNEIYVSGYGFGLSNHVTTDCEQLADQFASRFGLGGALSSGLVKYQKLAAIYYGVYDPMENIKIMSSFVGVYGFVLMLVSGFSILAATGGGVILFSFAFIMTVLGELSNVSSTSKQLSTFQTYDTGRQRIARLRNDLVRQVRLLNLDKDTAKAYLDNYNKIARLVEEMPIDDLNFFEKLYLKFSESARNGFEAKRIEEAIENLMENPLYISSLKFKTMGVKS